MQRVPKAWRWPLWGIVLSGVGALFVPVGGWLWVHALLAVNAVLTLGSMAHREIPFPVALAQLRLGGDDRNVLRGRVASAALCLPRGKVGLALLRLRAVVPELSRALGPEDPDTLSARSLLLQLEGATGRRPAHLPALESLLADLDRVLGPGHPDTLAGRYALAEWLADDGRFDEAEAAYRQVISAGTERVGPDSDVTLIARASLAALGHERPGGDRAAALDELSAVLADMERALGPGNPTTAGTRRLLTQWKRAQAGSAAN
ncbi:tetratricopeptide repeat protein [Kitasatospora sp. NPDC054939]